MRANCMKERHKRNLALTEQVVAVKPLVQSVGSHTTAGGAEPLHVAPDTGGDTLYPTP
jgi:hypothetical protein